MKYLGNRDGWDKFLDPASLEVVSLHNNEYADESSDYSSNWEKWTADEYVEVHYKLELKGDVLELLVVHPKRACTYGTNFYMSNQIESFIKSILK